MQLRLCGGTVDCHGDSIAFGISHANELMPPMISGLSHPTISMRIAAGLVKAGRRVCCR